MPLIMLTKDQHAFLLDWTADCLRADGLKGSPLFMCHTLDMLRPGDPRKERYKAEQAIIRSLARPMLPD